MKKLMEYLKNTLRVAVAVEGFGHEYVLDWGKDISTVTLVDIHANILTVGIEVFVGC